MTEDLPRFSVSNPVIAAGEWMDLSRFAILHAARSRAHGARRRHWCVQCQAVEV